jgi:hypothetical protein
MDIDPILSETSIDSELQILTRSLIESELTNLSLRLAHFQEMEQLLESEVRHVEAERIKLYSERISIKNGLGNDKDEFAGQGEGGEESFIL